MEATTVQTSSSAQRAAGVGLRQSRPSTFEGLGDADRGAVQQRPVRSLGFKPIL